jgi:dUTP pyrophosphatase
VVSPSHSGVEGEVVGGRSGLSSRAAPGPTRGPATLAVRVTLLDPDLSLPAYARLGDAGADLVARVDVTLAAKGGRALVPTGVALAIPDGFAGFVQPRSGLALRHGVTCLNTPGLIDSGYRDELAVLLVNTDPEVPYRVRRGDRIAQLVIQRVESAAFVEVDELEGTERGIGGFGSTGR